MNGETLDDMRETFWTLLLDTYIMTAICNLASFRNANCYTIQT